MATRNKPLMTAAALVSAAAVAVATPALAPSITSATPPALSSAKVNLTTFSDVLSITAADWNYTEFNGWGGAIGPINVDPETVENDYWLPDCNYDCVVPGISGIAYLALDALINGNGQGIDDASEWGVSAVNYMFEGSFITGVQYIVQKPFLTEGSPLYNPQVANLIALAFQGEYALTTIYVTALSAVAQLASTVPYIGEYLYRGIGSYIGPAFQTVDSIYDYSAYAGISGILRYVGGVITTGGNPNPYPVLQTTSASAVAAKLPAAVTAASAASSATETATQAVSSTPAVTVADNKVEAASTEATATPAESASTTAVTATVADSTAADTTSADTAVPTSVTSASSAVADSVTAAGPSTTSATAPKSRKRPVRDAVASAKKAVASAVSGAASAAGRADAAS